ncbi:MAG: amidohydrolase [Actinomycetia bacterium]|nr:amidohydrolase [Actinomycetes bacterium]
MRYYSCDSHVVEAREVFAGLDEQFGSKAPRILRDLNGQMGEFLVIGDARPVPVGRLGIAGNRLDDPKTDWVFDYCSPNPERLIGIGCLPVPDVDACVREVERAGTKGVRGFAIPWHAPVDQPYSDPIYDPLWAVLQEMDLPVTMHIFTGTSFDCGLPGHWGTPGGTIKGYTLAHTTVVNSTIDLICGGVVERFPRLKFVMAEFETGWIAHFKQCFEHACYRTPWLMVDYLTLRPTEYLERNFWVTFEDDVDGMTTRHKIGVENLLWGNDYPHHDSIWPHSMQTLTEVFQGVPDDEVEQMVWSNVVDLYNIDTSKLPA